MVFLRFLCLNMDSKISGELGLMKSPKSSDGQGATGNSKLVGGGNISSKDMIFRADKIDLKSLDIQLEKHLSRVWSKDREVKTHKEEWEIELAKLDLRNVIAHGTYGTVYRGVYDGQDVAGNLISHSAFLV